MSLITLVVVLIVVGVLLWLVNAYIPMDRKIKYILNVVVVIAVVIWLLQVFGVLGSFGQHTYRPLTYLKAGRRRGRGLAGGPGQAGVDWASSNSC